jgi:hypothetical protein
MENQIAALESKLKAQEIELREWRTREAAEGGGPSTVELLAEAKKRRELARKAVQIAQARLSALQGERREKTKELDKQRELVKQKSRSVVNPDLALPSIALRGGGDEAVVKEIQALLKESKELEETLAQHSGTRLHMEKLQNERRDTARKVKELKNEEKMVREQLEVKRAELAELQEQVKPSPVRARYELEVARLRKEINAHSAARTHAERETTTLQKRLLRVRGVLGGFLKAEKLKPTQSLPPADDELAGRLADYVIALHEKVRSLERTVKTREERSASLQESAAQAAEELKRLVARRGKEQRRTVAAGMLTDGQPAGDAAAGAGGMIAGAHGEGAGTQAFQSDSRRAPARGRAQRPTVKHRGKQGEEGSGRGARKKTGAAEHMEQAFEQGKQAAATPSASSAPAEGGGDAHALAPTPAAAEWGGDTPT